MSEPEWSIAIGIQSVAGLLLGTFRTAVYQEISPSTDTLLEYCRKELNEIKARLNEIPPERRDQIQAVVERGDCKSFQELETTLLELSDDLCKLKEHSENTPGWKRHLPATQLRNDITTLRDSLKSLLMDTYNTTNAPKPSNAPKHQEIRTLIISTG